MFLFFFYTWILSCQCIVRLFLGILVCGIYVLYMFRSEKFQESSHLFCSKCISLRAQFKDLLLYYTAEPSSEGRWEKILFSGCVVFCFFFFLMKHPARLYFRQISLQFDRGPHFMYVKSIEFVE